MKKQRGITLIALVITIIILIILAGVAINLTLGENGIFVKAKQSVNKTEYVSAKEILEMKLLDISTECITDKKEYTILEVAVKVKKSQNITIEKYYNSTTSMIRDGIIENLIDLKGIVVSVNDYQKYKFLIGKTGKITGVLIGNIEDITEETEFKEIDKFEAEEFGEKVATEKEYVESDSNSEDIICSSEAPERQKIKAFDENTGTSWLTNNESIGGYIGYNFKEKVSLYKINLYGYTVDGQAYWGRSIKTAKVQYSDDNAVWKDLETISTDFTQTDYDKYSEIQLTNIAEGRYWRIVITEIYDSSQTQTGTSEIKFFGTKNK